MTIADLFSNEELRQAEFPVAREKVFLAHAGVCPLPRRVAEAMRDYITQSTRGDQEILVPAFRLGETRKLAARLIQAKPEEIAFIGPTSLGLSIVAAGLRFRKGDNILVYFDDFPSNVYPWMALAEQGMQVRLLNVRNLGRVRAVEVMGQVDENTRLVALASAHFITGYRIDVEGIGKYLRERGILFCVDAIQSAGVFPLDARHVDFLVADSHKWMLGPSAAGLLYVRQQAQAQLHPPVFGWHNVLCPNFAAQEKLEFQPDARRYEAGTQNLVGLVGLHAAMELLLEIGVENIAAELLRKRAWLVRELQAKGCTVLEADAPSQNCSGITTFHRAGTDLEVLHKKLLAAGIATTLRSDRSQHHYIRLSPHFYNTEAELGRLLEQL